MTPTKDRRSDRGRLVREIRKHLGLPNEAPEIDTSEPAFRGLLFILEGLSRRAEADPRRRPVAFEGAGGRVTLAELGAVHRAHLDGAGMSRAVDALHRPAIAALASRGLTREALLTDPADLGLACFAAGGRNHTGHADEREVCIRAWREERISAAIEDVRSARDKGRRLAGADGAGRKANRTAHMMVRAIASTYDRLGRPQQGRTATIILVAGAAFQLYSIDANAKAIAAKELP